MLLVMAYALILGEFGPRQKWYFFVMPSYWHDSSRQHAHDDIQAHCDPVGENFEPIHSSMHAFNSIRCIGGYINRNNALISFQTQAI
jgi:hypothetical protein